MCNWEEIKKYIDKIRLIQYNVFMLIIRRNLIIFFVFAIYSNLYADEYRISAVRTYHVFNDLKYIQSIEIFNYTENNMLYKKTRYGFNPIDGFFLRNETIYKYNENNLLIEDLNNNSGIVTEKHYRYDENGKLIRTHLVNSFGIDIFSIISYRYEEDKIIAEGFQYKKYYDLNWNILLEEWRDETRKIYIYENNLLTRIEVYNIRNSFEILTSIEYVNYNENNQIINIETYRQYEGEFIWSRREINNYNSINNLSIKTIFNNEIFTNPIHIIEFNHVPYFIIMEYEYIRY